MSTTSLVQDKTPFANVSMKGMSTFILNTTAALGCDLSSQADLINNFFETGGYGFVPFIALVDDLNELRKRIHKISEGTSLSAQMGLMSVGSEVVFDLYELTASIGQICQISLLEGMANGSSAYAMNIKTVGAVILALSAIDEAYAEIYQTTGYLGSKCSCIDKTSSKETELVLSDTLIGKMLADDNSPLVEETQNDLYKKQISSVLRAGEVASAAMSNMALLAGQGPNIVFTAASLASNGLKYLRMGYNYLNKI